VNTLVQLREAVRYPVRASVFFSWDEERGIHLEGTGVTRDMSTKGVFVYSMVLPPKNASVDMEVTIPALREDAPSVRIHVRGRIVRTESNAVDPVHGGFAITSESTILRGGEHDDSEEGKRCERC
jgi:PilZ domain